MQGARDAGLEREAALEAEKAQLKAGLGGALEQRQAAEAQLASLAAQQQALRQAVGTPWPICPISVAVKLPITLLPLLWALRLGQKPHYMHHSDHVASVNIVVSTHWPANSIARAGAAHACTEAKTAAQAEEAAAREAEASQRAEQAAQDAAEVHELARREAALHEAALQEASQKAARLARLEGKRPFLPLDV